MEEPHDPIQLQDCRVSESLRGVRAVYGLVEAKLRTLDA